MVSRPVFRFINIENTFFFLFDGCSRKIFFLSFLKTNDILFIVFPLGPPQVLNEVSSRFVSVERGDDAVVRAVFCADPRPIRVSWRWAAFQMEAGSGSGRFVAEALHKVSPTVLPPPAIVDFAEDDDSMSSTDSSNSNAYDTTIESSTTTTHHPRSLEVVPTALAMVARPPQAVFTYPVYKYAHTQIHLRNLTHTHTQSLTGSQKQLYIPYSYRLIEATLLCM